MSVYEAVRVIFLRSKRNKFNYIVVFLILILLVVFAIGSTEYVLKRLYPREYSNYVEKYSYSYNLDENLVYAIIKAESGFNSQAVSPRNAKGLMQILDSTGEWAAKKIKIKDFKTAMLLEPETNIRIGCWYMATLLKQFDNNTELALAAYNAGSGNVSKWLKDSSNSSNGKTLSRIPFEETNNYVNRIGKYYKMYKKLYDKRK